MAKQKALTLASSRRVSAVDKALLAEAKMPSKMNEASVFLCQNRSKDFFQHGKQPCERHKNSPQKDKVKEYLGNYFYGESR